MTVDSVAKALWEAELTSSPIEPLPTGVSLTEAYAIQAAGLGLRIAGGATRVGRKVGLTSTAMQTMLGVNQPDFGYLTSMMVSETGVVLPATQFIAPRVEGEIAFRLRQPLSGATAATEDILAAVEAVAPAIEIIDSRIANWQITIADTIADNASCGHVVLGAWQAIGALELASLEIRTEVRDANGTETVVTGLGSEVLGHPANAVAWLARALHEYAGEGIEAGDVILPGAAARALPVGAGSTTRVCVQELGEVSLTLAPEGRRRG